MPLRDLDSVPIIPGCHPTGCRACPLPRGQSLPVFLSFFHSMAYLLGIWHNLQKRYALLQGLHQRGIRAAWRQVQNALCLPICRVHLALASVLQ